MKVLIGCEKSGVLRNAFRGAGHDAWSCDIDPSDDNSPYHIVGDVLDQLYGGYDMAVFHPPCTYLSTVGNRHFKTQPDRKSKRLDAAIFFLQLWYSPIPKIVIENPQGYMNTHWKKPNATIHPYYFGDGVMKRTCLWTKNLPPLIYDKTKYPTPEPMYICKGKVCNGKKIYSVEGCRGTTSKNRSYIRAKTYPMLAKELVKRWG